MEYRPPGGFSNFLRDLNGASSFPFPPSSHPLHPGDRMPGFPFPYHPQFMVPPATSSSVRGSPFASDSRSPSPANIGQHRVSADGEVMRNQGRGCTTLMKRISDWHIFSPNIGYYLADGIYPEWAAFVKTVREPQTEKHQLFAQKQEGARKDVERAFGVLRARFKIIAEPSRLWDQSDIGQIMRACVILHNMIVEDEKEMVEDFIDLNETPGSSTATAPTIHLGSIPEFTRVIEKDAEIRDRTMHNQLKKDLVEHIWQRFGHNTNN